MTLDDPFSLSGSQHDALREAAQASSNASSASRDVRALADRLDRLTLVCRAMWEVLKEKGYTEEELVVKVAVLDAADGTVDGKKTPKVAQCHKCQRPMKGRSRKCMYCNAEKPLTSVFDTI